MSHLNQGYASSRLRYTKGDADQVVAPAGNAIVHYTVMDYDALREFDPVATWSFTPRRAGYYLIDAAPLVGLQVNNGFSVSIRVNAVVLRISTLNSSAVIAGDNAVIVSDILYITPNDVVDIQCVNIGVLPLAIRLNTQTSFSVHRLS